MENQFVVGFAYTPNGRCLLMEKNRPEWQKGSLNGIGGKIEAMEAPDDAMSREAMEEAGLDLDWERRGVMRGINNDGRPFECHIYYAHGQEVENFIQVEDEPLALYSLDEMFARQIVDNLAYLVPFGLSGDRAFLNLDYS